MKDEIWMRTWDEGHPRFSADLHRGLVWLVKSFRRIGARIIGRATHAEPMRSSAPQRDAA